MNKQELIEYLEKEISNFKSEQMIYDYLTFILKQVKQLDTLSPEWIEENSTVITDLGTFGHIERNKAVPAEYLYGILVPKQSLPTVSQFVADYFESIKHDFNFMLKDTFNEMHRIVWDDRKELTGIHSWLDKDGSIEILSDMKRYGYEIEQEPKYRIELPNSEYGVVYIAKDLVTGKPITRVDVHDGDYVTDLTEDDIKKLDPRFWPFAKPVEEVEDE